MNTHEENALKILVYASKLDMQEPIMPVADTKALTGFSYPQLKEILSEFAYADIMLLKELENAGYLTGTFKDRVLLCPYCLAYNIIFRDTCPECFSPNLETTQMIHHYRCGYVGSETEFFSDGILICPKCSQKLKHIGKDFEKPSEIYNCLDCNWSGSEAMTSGRCLACNAQIEQDNYIVYDVKSYIITQEGLLAAKTGEINLVKKENKELPTKEEIINQQWSIISLLGITNVLGLISERYGVKLSGMSIFTDAVHKALTDDINKNIQIEQNLIKDFTIEKNSVIDDKIFALIKAVLEKVRKIIRPCDCSAISGDATIFIILPETSAKEVVTLAKRLSNEIGKLSFSGAFNQTTLSIGIAEWQKGFEPTDLFQYSKTAMETAIKKGGNQIEIYTNGMDAN